MPTSVRDRPDLEVLVRVLGATQLLGAGDARGPGSDQRQQAALERALVQFHVVADLEAADHLEQLL
jgi:hypothetical protein